MTDRTDDRGRPDVEILACERAQTDWLDATALLAGGEVWEDDDLHWSWNPSTRTGALTFPTDLPLDGVRDGLARLDGLGADAVAVWLVLGTPAGGLADLGLRIGWSPWWMVAELPLPAGAEDPRVLVDRVVPEPDVDSDRRAWHAVARVDGYRAGGAWIHRVGDVAGLFDMGVDPRWGRRGLGTALLDALAAAAAADGARLAVLNATPAGAGLYARRGFRRVGDGITWWWHRE